jgi:RimJ/RimL family protein N-acetyltransferase
MHIVCETNRLRLCALTLQDAAFILELLNTPDWLKFIGDRNVRTTEQAVSYLRNGPLKSYAENGYGLWLVVRKDDNRSIGLCGLLKRDYLDMPDLGFAFLPDVHSQGYGYESATAAMSWIQEHHAMRQIGAIVDPANHKSIRLLEKLGFTFQSMIKPPASEDNLSLYTSYEFTYRKEV